MSGRVPRIESVRLAAVLPAAIASHAICRRARLGAALIMEGTARLEYDDTTRAGACDASRSDE
ncbi:hypothetical protein Corgl_1131 [Coriobacterium glomerans PW2]|uniref:Uncharacterized protein n=1 Tax=Coriobacterium glomerans (strain ATCC 49209 / DSM 20642 / JCM 10262 / PW2) TaxID=700015 RepID=F2N854_CORGP|nr:hypothetical protein [Coriobacterium glomerans]AEB07237.1 hypothetical protein Corgl_1131 [Coriobacterium glomerans PW2]